MTVLYVWLVQFDYAEVKGLPPAPSDWSPEASYVAASSAEMAMQLVHEIRPSEHVRFRSVNRETIRLSAVEGRDVADQARTLR